MEPHDDDHDGGAPNTSQPAKIKALKYIYNKQGGKWGIKVNGKEQCTAGH
jgi:hypothetical protein